MLSCPNMIFSVTVRGGTSMKCWWTMPIPWEMASCGEVIFVGWPLMLISPSSGWYRPYKMFIKVDLPAPFSPNKA